MLSEITEMIIDYTEDINLIREAIGHRIPDFYINESGSRSGEIERMFE